MFDRRVRWKGERDAEERGKRLGRREGGARAGGRRNGKVKLRNAAAQQQPPRSIPSRSHPPVLPSRPHTGPRRSDPFSPFSAEWIEHERVTRRVTPDTTQPYRNARRLTAIDRVRNVLASMWYRSTLITDAVLAPSNSPPSHTSRPSRMRKRDLVHASARYLAHACERTAKMETKAVRKETVSRITRTLSAS